MAAHQKLQFSSFCHMTFFFFNYKFVFNLIYADNSCTRIFAAAFQFSFLIINQKYYQILKHVFASDVMPLNTEKYTLQIYEVERCFTDSHMALAGLEFK